MKANGDKSIHRIIVGCDGSPESQLALEWAADTARREGSKLLLVHGAGLTSMPSLPGFEFSELEPVLETAESGLLKAEAAQRGAGLDAAHIETQYWLGSPAGQIVDLSEDADLVVVGSRGRGRMTGGLLGSTAYAVAAHAHCPVVVVRRPKDDHAGPTRPGPGRDVVVGVDDSETAEHALDAAATIASDARAVLHVVGVAHVAFGDRMASTDVTGGVSRTTHAIRDRAELAVTRAANRARARHPRLFVITSVVDGDPGHVLAELAAGAGLVVVGSRGRGGFAGMLLGSVSHTVIHEATCPVMVVR